eukprot:Lithocolla_globosa_v1_NODE_837_length_3207_cov_25.878490.p1 type:complete len:461 gc:universal NODE_837_length_3207_cov_25.878490:2679-1297(-)
MLIVSEEHWDILTPIEESTSTTAYEYFQILEQQGGSDIPLSQPLFTFEMRDTDAFVKASDAYLHVRAKIQTAAGGDYGAKCGFMNTGMLFSRADYLIDNKIIETVENVHMSTLVRDLLEYSDDYGKAGAQDQLYFKDGPSTGCGANSHLPFTSNLRDGTVLMTAGGAGAVVAYREDGATALADDAIVDLSTSFSQQYYNDGWKKRSFLSSGVAGTSNNYVTMRIPLRRLFGFATINRITTGVRHTVRLTRNEAVACTAGPNATSVKFQSLSIYYPYLKPSYPQLSLLTDQLSKNSRTKLSFETANCYSKPLSAGATSVNWDVASVSEKINKVVFMLIPTADLTLATANKAVFTNALVTRIFLKIGSFRYPHSQDFTPVFNNPANANYGWEPLYNEHLRCSDKIFNSDSGPAISYQEFRDVYPIFCFDVRNQDENLFGAGRPQDLRIEATMTGDDYTACCI